MKISKWLWFLHKSCSNERVFVNSKICPKRKIFLQNFLSTSKFCCAKTRRDKSLFKTWSESWDFTKVAVAAAVAAAVAGVAAATILPHSRGIIKSFLSQKVTQKLKSSPGTPGTPGTFPELSRNSRNFPGTFPELPLYFCFMLHCKPARPQNFKKSSGRPGKPEIRENVWCKSGLGLS